MSSSSSIGKLFVLFLRIAMLVITVPVALNLARFAKYPSATSAAFLIVGGGALILMEFPLSEIAAAVRDLWRSPNQARTASSGIYEAAARNAVGLGVLGTTAGFAIQFSSEAGSPDHFLGAVADTVLTTLYGLILAMLFGVTGWRLKRRADGSPVPPERLDSPPGAGTGGIWPRWAGFAVFAALIEWVLFVPPAGGQFPSWHWLVSWGALLAVAGGALVLGLLLGDPTDRGALTLGLACAGTISALFGLVRALHGFSETSIELVASGSAWIISSCFAALVGVLLTAASGEDRPGPAGKDVTRLVWYGLPAVCLFFLALVVLMVMTPMTAPGPR